MTPDDRAELRDLVPAYALGALDPDDEARMTAAVAADPSLAAEVAAYREMAGLFGGEAAPPVPVPAGLRARVLATTPGSGERPLRLAAPAAPQRATPAPTWWVALAAAVLLAVGLAWQVRALRVEREALADRLAVRERELNSILEPGVELVRLAATEQGAHRDAGIQLFVDHEKRRAIVHAFRLPPVPAGKAYQLWFIEEGQAPIPSVTFNTEASGHGLVQEVSVPAGKVFVLAAITVEPAGGSTAPTLPIQLAGAFRKS
ncbi:MAG: anti-sigma factor [Gemmatimonadales bacterium]|nr:anti-sigma factor [Gemmatimonadales bacterium]